MKKIIVVKKKIDNNNNNKNNNIKNFLEKKNNIFQIQRIIGISNVRNELRNNKRKFYCSNYRIKTTKNKVWENKQTNNKVKFYCSNCWIKINKINGKR